MTPAELKALRTSISLSGAEFARLLGYEGQHLRQMMHELESGVKRIREPQRRLAIAYRDGYRPDDWPDFKQPHYRQAASR